MSNYVNLNIKIDLEGDINIKIPKYDYSIHSDPTSKYNNIYIPLKTLIGHSDAFKNSIYSKDPKQVFFTTTRLIEFLSNRPEIFKHMSDQKYNKLASIRADIAKVKDIISIQSFEESSANSIELENLQKKAREIKKQIDTANINLILSLLFKKNTAFYYKNQKYRINSFKIINYGLDNIETDLPSYNDLINDLVEERSDVIYQIKLNKYKSKLKLEKLSDSDKKTKLKDEKTKLKEETLSKAIEEYTSSDISDKVNKYGKFIMETLNNIAIKNNQPLRYIYEKNIGVKTAEDRSSNKHVSTKLNIINEKTKHISNIKTNCKTKKNKIQSLLKKVFGILPPPTQKEMQTREYKGYLLFYNKQIKNNKDLGRSFLNYNVINILVMQKIKNYILYYQKKKNKQKKHIKNGYQRILILITLIRVIIRI